MARAQSFIPSVDLGSDRVHAIDRHFASVLFTRGQPDFCLALPVPSPARASLSLIHLQVLPAVRSVFVVSLPTTRLLLETGICFSGMLCRGFCFYGPLPTACGKVCSPVPSRDLPDVFIPYFVTWLNSSKT
jgi:hypothetical protein